MKQSRVERINELARIARTRELTAEEQAERAKLREEYLSAFRKNLQAQLDNTYLVDEEGNKRKLPKKE